MSDPTSDYLDRLALRLESRERAGLLRRLVPAAGVDFASNDYLSLADHERVRRRMMQALESGPAGAPASRLLRGNHAAHEEAEARFARFKGAEAAALFSSGYLANIGLCQALLGPNDVVMSDALNHASLIDGIRLTKARRRIVPHRDLDAIEGVLREERGDVSGDRFIVTEALFSMDGDLAPLDALARLAREYDARLLVDEAHATGLYGEARGAGLVEALGVEADVTATMSTCGKALGLAGAFVAGPREVIDTVINHARSFIYTTAPVPALAEGICEALDVLADEPWRRARVLGNARLLRTRLAERGVTVPFDESPIVPVLVGDDERSLAVAGAVRELGYDVRALRPPTVPPGTARLRVSVHADHTEAQLVGLAEAIAGALARFPHAGGAP